MTVDYQLCVHHIGGRDGARAFPRLERFEQDIVTVVYDADADCVEQMREASSHGGSQSLVALPYCIAGSSGRRTFNINYDPYTSSLYNPNPDLAEYYFFQLDHDYIFSEVVRPMERRLVSTVTLDDLFGGTSKIDVPSPDFLSMDTQGSEYEILQGAERTLSSSVVALKLEVEFIQLYDGQKLFGDLSQYLEKRGFVFTGFTALHQMSPHRLPLGMRAEGFTICGDALFLRRLDSAQMTFGGEQLRRALKRLAFIAMNYGLFEYGTRCLDVLDSIGGLQNHGGDNSFDLFFRELRAAMTKMPQIYPGTFSQRYSWEESKLRFAPEAEQNKPRPKNEACREILQFHLDELQKHLTGHSTPIELTLLSWGMEELANQIRTKRFDQLQKLAAFLESSAR
jgi:FkbM family methyltransferase